MGASLVLAAVTIRGCLAPEEPVEVGTVDLPSAGGLFVLVHPTDAPPAGPGVVELDEDGVEVARLPLPPGVTSPHGLAFDGVSLWLAEYADEGGIFELDPSDGTVRSEIAGFRTEGIAVDGDGFWVDGPEGLARIDRTGAETDRRPGGSVVQDVAFDGVDVLFLTNGDGDTVTRVAPDGSRRTLEHPVTRDNRGYAMALRAGELLVADAALEDEGLPYLTAVIRHVDPLTGELWSTSLLAVEGWVTAIAPSSP